MAYATVSQLLDRYDARVLGKYAGDAGVVVPPGSLATNSRIAAVLNDATAMINAALNKQKKYTRQDIEDLILSDDGHLIIRICCDLAVGLLLESRLLPASEVGKLVPRYKEARDWCNRLSVGTEVLPITNNMEAGLPDGTVKPASPISQYNRMFGFWGPYNGNY